MVESTGAQAEAEAELAKLGPDKRPVRTRPVTEDIDEVFERIY